MSQLLNLTECGIYCSAGDFYIDPWRPVQKAFISHAHSDHARSGNATYICHKHTTPILELRLGNLNNFRSVDYGESISVNGVKITFHPAGHIIGSSQIRVEHNGRVEVFSGDYKTSQDGLSTPFEPIKCHHFISESTFGLPVFKFSDTNQIATNFQDWVKRNNEKGLNSIVFAYSLGKAQRIVNLSPENVEVFVHDSIFKTNQVIQSAGISLNAYQHANEFDKLKNQGALIITPPATMDSKWLKRFEPYSTAYASGWMQIRGNKKRLAVDKGIVISDHADFQGIIEAVNATGCEKVSFTHGYADFMARHFSEKSLEATVLKTDFMGDHESQSENLVVSIPE